MSQMNLVAEPAAELAHVERVPESVKSGRRLRLCIMSHPRYDGVAGHLPEYLASIVQEACRREWSVSLFAPPKLCEYVEKTEGSRHANLRLSPHWPAARGTGGAEPSFARARITGWIATLRAYCAIAAMRGCDHLLIMDGDQNDTAFAIGLLALPLLRCGVSAIVFGSVNGIAKNSRHSSRSLGQKARLCVARQFFRLKKFRGIITTNPAFATTDQNLSNELERMVRYVREIEPQWNQPMPTDEAKRILGIEQHWRVVLCYGALGADHK